jgi:hypothetical protein
VLGRAGRADALILAGAAFLTLAMVTSACPGGCRWIGGWPVADIADRRADGVLHYPGLFRRHLDGGADDGVIRRSKSPASPFWFGIFVVLVVEMAQITPPVGLTFRAAG